MADLVYKVEDKSILLPYYKRLLIGPFLPFIPAKLTPNAITHIGHLVNLTGTALVVWLCAPRLWGSNATPVTSGWPFFAAAFAVNLYTWCDNVDGAHARRTGQCSPFGEFLDHGLDQLNSVYMAYLTCATLGLAPLGWVVMALLIPGGATLTYWEQSHTGLLKVGRLNQIESVAVMTIALVITGIFGISFWDTALDLGALSGALAGVKISLRDGMFWWPAITILFGMARNVVRVAAQCGIKSSGSALVYFAAIAAIVAAAQVQAMPMLAGVALGSVLNVHLGMRMLARRLKKEVPQVEPFVVVCAAAAIALSGLKLIGRPVGEEVVSAGIALLCTLLGLLAALDARDGVLVLSRAKTA